MSSMTNSAVKPFAAAQHVEVLREPARAGLGPLGIVQPPGDRVPVACVERLEGRSGNGVGLELALEVVGNDRGALPLVGGIPAAVGAGTFDLGQARRTHASGGDELLGLVAVDARPAAAPRARCEALSPVRIVAARFLAVYPAKTERDLDRLGVGNGGLGRALLRDLEPNPAVVFVVVLQPCLELSRDGEPDAGVRRRLGHARCRSATISPSPGECDPKASGCSSNASSSTVRVIGV